MKDRFTVTVELTDKKDCAIVQAVHKGRVVFEYVRFIDSSSYAGLSYVVDRIIMDMLEMEEYE